MTRIQIVRWGALISHQGLLFLLLAWHAWLVPSRYFPVSMVLLLLLTPLLLPLRGLLRGRPYTYAWTTFPALFYFTYNIGLSFGPPADRPYAVAGVVLSGMLFTFAALYARWEGRARKLKTPLA